MRIAVIAPPFIPVPPHAYGGTELFIAHLAESLQARGHKVIVYANGDSSVGCELRWIFEHADWPLRHDTDGRRKNAEHTAWAIQDAARCVDVLHLNDIAGLPFSGGIEVPMVLTLHHPFEPTLTRVYLRYPAIQYVAISEHQRQNEPMPNMVVVHHGLRVEDYRFSDEKDEYVAFLGRMAPCKGAHLAIEVARRSGRPLVMAGEIQPIFRDYWEREVEPFVDDRQIRFIGEADLRVKNELLGRARALLFPIQWDEPFGLVMLEAMACGTPVLALPGGSVPELVRDGVSGWVCKDVEEMARRVAARAISAKSCRSWAETHFSSNRMAENYLHVYDRALRNIGESTRRDETASRPFSTSL